MIDFEPKYITFDCYGTLTKFRMADMAREIYGDRLQGAELEKFVAFFAGYRLDEVLGAWKPYRDVVVNALRRACQRMGVAFNESEAEKYLSGRTDLGPAPGRAGRPLAPREEVQAGRSCRMPRTTRSRATSTSSARRSIACSPRSRRSRTSRACRDSSTCSTS